MDMEARSSFQMSAFAGALYTATALTMSFTNKFTVGVFPHVNSIIVLQFACTLGIFQVLMQLQLLHIPMSWGRCRQQLWLSVLYTGNTTFALLGLKTLNIPMYTTLKRLTPIVVLTCKSLMQHKVPSRPILCSVLLVVTGCIVAGAADLAFDLYGYACALVSCLLQAGYLLLVEQQAPTGVTPAEIMYYNALLCTLPLLLLTALTGEAPVALSALTHPAAPTVWPSVALCATLGCLLQFALFLCTLHNSALTTVLLGVFRSVALTVLGFWVLNTAPVSGLNVCGIALTLAGGVWYSWIKFSAKLAAQAAGLQATAAGGKQGSGEEQRQPLLGKA